jgi:hypothetical protein
MMADHWGFVVAAYGLSALVLAGYWRHLVRRERQLTSNAAATAPGPVDARARTERS